MVPLFYLNSHTRPLPSEFFKLYFDSITAIDFPVTAKRAQKSNAKKEEPFKAANPKKEQRPKVRPGASAGDGVKKTKKTRFGNNKRIQTF